MAVDQLADMDLFLFRESNLVAAQGLTLTLLRGNTIILRGGDAQEVQIIE